MDECIPFEKTGGRQKQKNKNKHDHKPNRQFCLKLFFSRYIPGCTNKEKKNIHEAGGFRVFLFILLLLLLRIICVISLGISNHRLLSMTVSFSAALWTDSGPRKTFYLFTGSLLFHRRQLQIGGHCFISLQRGRVL